MTFTDQQRQHLKYVHNNYIWDISYSIRKHQDAFGTFLAQTPIYTGYSSKRNYPGYMHITQRNILVLLHKLGLKYQ